MKRTSTIAGRQILALLFLAVFSFNIVGYYGLYVVTLRGLNDEFSERVHAEEYAGSDVQIVKLPMTLPYLPNFDGYERAEGTFDYNGQLYRISKYNLVSDTLYVVLVKDIKSTELNQRVADFVKSSNGEPSSSRSSLGHLENFFKDFVKSVSQVQLASKGWCIQPSVPMFGVFAPLDAFLQKVSPPPEV